MNDWKLSCVGVVERVERVDIDKSGANEKIKVHVVLRVEEATAEAPDAELGELVTFGILAHALRQISMRTPKAGERVTVEGLASGVRPDYARLTGLTFHEAPEPLF
ncbi:MAG: hypothetical protein EP329_13140 [Deltaproteobacteria bacterium]|nr:MAG: hypothetical protein EP329_13140 [Deltaproteobacteria bacterium]